jgi:NAD(P)-dependent dehydrogenase (short-subunit alcohol dehydrogenase family)
MTRPVILVTGGSRGIGAATCRLAAAAGYDVAVNYASNREAADAVVSACQEVGASAVAVQALVESEADVIAMFEEVVHALGPIACLVNNAGIVRDQVRFDEMSVERWREMFEINVIGSFVCAREAVLRMSTRHGGAGGSIVNVSSAASYLGSPGEYIDYAASKAAIDTMTMGLGKEVAEEGIRVNAVRPGVVYTDIHASGGEPGRVNRVAGGVPMRRGGQPEEVAETILWLASDAASYITATTLNVSGGR